MTKVSRRDLLKGTTMLGISLPLTLTAESASAQAWTGTGSHPTGQNRPVCPQGAPPESASFIDPTVTISGDKHITMDQLVYLGPFARLSASSDAEIHIGSESGSLYYFGPNIR